MTNLRSMRDAFEETWHELHSEKCTNMDDCASFGGTKKCYCPRPPELSAEPACAHANMRRVDGFLCTDCGGYRPLDEPEAPLQQLNRTSNDG